MNGIDQSWLWFTGAVMLLIGVVAGILLAKPLLPGAQRARKLEKELEEAKAEQARYRQQVTEHFEKTGELFQEMAQGYRTVYDHLARGAHELCREGTETPRLDLPERRLLSGGTNPGSEDPVAAKTPESGQRAEASASPDERKHAASTARELGGAKETGSDASPPSTQAAPAEPERRPTSQAEPAASDTTGTQTTGEAPDRPPVPGEKPEKAAKRSDKEPRPAVH